MLAITMPELGSGITCRQKSIMPMLYLVALRPATAQVHHPRRVLRPRKTLPATRKQVTPSDASERTRQGYLFEF